MAVLVGLELGIDLFSRLSRFGYRSIVTASARISDIIIVFACRVAILIIVLIIIFIVRLPVIVDGWCGSLLRLLLRLGRIRLLCRSRLLWFRGRLSSAHIPLPLLLLLVNPRLVLLGGQGLLRVLIGAEDGPLCVTDE